MHLCNDKQQRNATNYQEYMNEINNKWYEKWKNKNQQQILHEKWFYFIKEKAVYFSSGTGALI